jgi:hypothetical protein
MTQNFVRYSPDVEQPEPDFDRTLQAILDGMKERMRGSIQAEGIGRMMRDAHAKGYGLARAEVEILSGLTEPFAQGIYTKPGRYEAMVRFSNGTNHVGDDRFLGQSSLCSPVICALLHARRRSLVNSSLRSASFRARAAHNILPD